MLKRARFAQVGEYRAFIRTLFNCAAELRGSQYGNVELAGEHFETAGDVGDFLHAVVIASIAAHQLEVVDDDEIEPIFHMQAAAFGAQLQRGYSGCIVQENLGVGEHFNGMGKFGPFIVAEFACAQTLGVDACFLRDHTLGDLLVGHLKREDSDMFFMKNSRIPRNRHEEARFTLTGTTSDDEQVGGV